MGSLEKPTLIERFVELIPLSYPLGALVWTIVLGTPGGILFSLVDNHQPIFLLTANVLYNNISLVIALFYLSYIPRYLRLRLLAAEHQILPIMPGGEMEYHAAFRQFNSTLPVVILAIPFATPAIGIVSSGVSVSTVFYFVQFIIIALGLGNFVWEYAVSSWGLHRLGESKLRLKSFLEDRTMGAKPVGNTALSATIAYLGGLLFLTLLGTSNPNVNGPIFYVAVALLLAIGVAMFFLPLNSLHKKMQEEKIREQRELSLRFLSITRLNPADLSDGPVSGVNGQNAIVELLRLKQLEIAERKLSSTPTWPFDVQVLARLITIVLSVTAVLVSRFLTDFILKGI